MVGQLDESFTERIHFFWYDKGVIFLTLESIELFRSRRGGNNDKNSGC